MTVRLYGHVHGYGSLAQVTRGFQLALGDRIEATVPLDEPASLKQRYLGAMAKYGVLTGRLDQLEALRMNAQHAHRCVMVAPNSNQIGTRLAERISGIATEVLTPSGWGADQLRKLVTPPVTVVPHGVFPEFEPGDPAPLVETYEKGRFAVVHVSTSAYGRKGTHELIHGWLKAYRNKWIPEKSCLCLVLDTEAFMNAKLSIQQSVQSKAVNSIVLRQRGGAFGAGMSPGQMALLLRSVHAVVQPSRGEGFGLVPLEARACGTPVLATLCTGHTEHMNQETPGIVVIDHGPDDYLDDLPNSVAPIVEPEAIAHALRLAYDHWEILVEASRGHAATVRKLWNWKSAMAEWTQTLEEK
jgi:glycosyltransferase involved in cell wall biosynthesis